MKLVRKFDLALERARMIQRRIEMAGGFPAEVDYGVKDALLACLERLVLARAEVTKSQSNLVEVLTAAGVDVNAHHAVIGGKIRELAGL